MRTTVTLDSDTEALVRKMMRDRQISFKEALNQAIRLGIGGHRQKSPQPFRQKTYRMGFRPEFRWDKALALADAIDDEKPVRKLQFRK